MHLNKTLDGTWHGDLTLDPDDGETVDTALRQIIADDPLTDSDGTPIRTMAERRADPLVSLCRRYLDHQPARTGRRQRPHVNIVLPITGLDNGIGGRYLTSSGPVTPDRVRELCCDANIHRVLTDSHSIILDHSAAERTVPPALFHTLEVRDQHCRYPGCDRPPAWCDAHHVVHWIDDGPTIIDNCVLLCRRHHRRCHQPGFHATLTPDGTVTITTPAGTVLVSHTPLHQLALTP